MKKVNHVKIAKFVISKKAMNSIKGGGPVAGCTCDITKDHGCINGPGQFNR